MRVFKPNFVTPMPAVFDDGRRLHCVVTAIFHADFAGTLLEERDLWTYAPEEVEGAVLDEAMPKTRGEWLVHGHCFARGPDVRQSFVKARVGDREKILAVFGPRVFKHGVPSTPEPFDSVPVRFTHAFGGEGFAENPKGKGFDARELPQIETRGQLISAPSDRPPVASFGRIDVTLPQRMKKSGTYDTRWLKTRYPGMAEDFDPTYFQLASPDQWIATFWKGTEAFSVVNMHPDREQLDGALPNVVARCFVKRRGEPLVDVAMRIDTVHLFPHLERQVIVCRGTTTTKSDTLDDVEEVGCGLEWIGRPKTQEHYESVFAARRSKNGGALAALDDTALMPEAAPKPKERIVAPGEGLRQRQIERKLRHKYEALKQKMIDNNVDLKHLPPFPTIDTSVDPDDVPPLPPEPPTVEGIQAQIKDKRAERIGELREKIAKNSADLPPEAAERIQKQLEEVVDRVENGRVGPPTFSRKETQERLADQAKLLENARFDASPLLAQLHDPKLDQRLRELEAFVRETYRTTVQHQGHPPRLSREASEPLRTRARIQAEGREPFEGIDLTGADLSGLDLRGADLRKAWLEATDLTGVDFTDANLEGAVLARAKLRGADLTRCNLAGVNLSEADLAGANLSGQDLTGCFFARADLTETNLSRATLDGVDLEGAKLVRTDLSGTRLVAGLFLKLRFEDVVLREAQWKKTVLYQCELVGLDARSASLEQVMFVDSRLERVRFDDATLEQLLSAKIDDKTVFDHCSFVGARAHLGLFRGADVTECDFRHADLEKSDFSGATVDGSTFEDARAVGARFIGASVRKCRFDRTDLMSSFFGSATLDDASFVDANLFRSDFGRSGGDNVKMNGANVKRVRTVPKREEAP